MGVFSGCCFVWFVVFEGLAFNISLFLISLFPHLAVKLGENIISKYKMSDYSGLQLSFCKEPFVYWKFGSSEAGVGGSQSLSLTVPITATAR